MALPKKGIRKITVQNQQYYWTVKMDYYQLGLMVGIGLVESPNQHVSFLCKFDDPWLSFPTPVDNEVNAITPSLIREAILFANANDEIEWNGKRNSVFRLESGHFLITE